MKVVVQNGVQHTLSRTDVEAMISEFPSKWNEMVNSIILCGERTSEIRTSFHKKEGSLAVYHPMNSKEITSKNEMIAELVVALAIVAELGELPKIVRTSLRQRLLGQEQNVLEKCYKKVAGNAA